MALLRLPLCLAATLLGSCSHPLNQEQYRQFLRDPAHGLTQQATNGPAIITCSYLPTDLLLAQDVEGVDSVQLPAIIDSVRRNYAGRTYLSLSLANGGAEIESQFLADQVAYAQSIDYLGSGITRDVCLVTPTRDSVAAIASTYSRLYGGTGKSTVLLVFDTQALDLRQGFTFVFRDARFGLGTVRLPFSAAALHGLPALQLAPIPSSL